MIITRREVVTAIATSGALALGTSVTSATAAEDGKAAVNPGLRQTPGNHPIVPLAFDPRQLRGLSERLIVSHHDNNYGGAVKNLNKLEEELARVNSETPGFILAGLKERELLFTNSIILHEHYFGNLGGDGKASGSIQKALADSYGGFGGWEESFRATGMSLAGGSGWTILDLNFHTGALRTYWAGNHTQSVAFGAPLLVMDMYEHAYQMDYGAAAAKYVEAFFANVRWEEVDRRFERAQRAAAAMRL